MNKKVLFMTWAHNAEKTLRMAMDSILSQTHTNFVYLVLDNASTDGTGDIIREYAARDPRVRHLHSDVNIFNIFHNVQLIDEEYDWFAVLDADDEYSPDFLEKTLAFAEEEDLDIVCCGSEHVDAYTLKVTGSLNISGNKIFGDGASSWCNYMDYHFYSLSVWGKLISRSVMRIIDFKTLEDTLEFSSGLEDRYFGLEMFKHAKRIGILGVLLHRYYTYANSAVRTFRPGRFHSYLLTYHAGKDFLLKKCGEISEENGQHLLLSFVGSAAFTVKLVVADSHLTFYEKAKEFHDILTHEQIQTVFSERLIPESLLDRFICGDILNWIITQAEYNGPEATKAIAGLIGAMFNYVLRKYPLMHGVSPGLARALPGAVRSVIQGDYAGALERFISESQDTEIAETDTEAYIIFGQNLAAAAGDAAAYIHFKKVWASYLLDCSRNDDAVKVLDEFEPLVPGDEDFAMLRERLGGK
jgi:glycosyltransferase involved in cell wall biosynthesis